jgi:hypothetical protein
VLFAGRSRWFHKLESLQRIVQDLRDEFCAAAAELSAGIAIDPAAEWEALEAIHDDMNTCLREIVVMLKCFLRALPAEEVSSFQQGLESGAETKHLSRMARLVRASS